MKPTLYGYYRSSCTYRVRIGLNLKNIDYEYRPINLLKLEQTKEEYKKINPIGEVPSFEFEFLGQNYTVFQSLAILNLLDQLYPKCPLWPVDPIERVHAVSIAEIINSGIQPFQNVGMLLKLEEYGINKNEWAKNIITKKFEALESCLSNYSGNYCVKNVLSIADVCLVPQVYNALKFEIDMKNFPIISRINDNLLTIKAFQKAHPDNQPDSPKQ